MSKSYISKRYANASTNKMVQKSNPRDLYTDLIDFSLGDPDLNTNKEIINRAFEDALNGYTHYTEAGGRYELRQELSKYYKERFDFDYSPDEIMITTSACHAIFLALEATLDDGDEIIIPTPHFTLYTEQVTAARGVPVYVETFEEDEFQIDIERLESKITDRTKGIILNTPNNPTGACIGYKNLKEIAEIAIKHDLLIYSDDIYTIYSFKEEFIPMATLENMKSRTITLGSFSKDFCMTGWRIGYIAASADIIDTAVNINSGIIYSAPTISQQGALHALRMRHEVQPELIDEFKKRVFYAAERINSMKNISVLQPGGTFYLFPNIKKTGLTSEEVTKKLLEEVHILVIPGNAFGEMGEGYIRIACTMSVEKMKEAFDRMEKVFN